ncbi:hypothetical protein COV82_05730 [Candidatus Peregrinibacteria bacterium CG11_big_fil_rev_8_21_14_0_20_46_8]|nr:MAG: hypothetical protein COV82_05730 [Candidatus Peregrinibacteria bacterium CG11_big_fil_rev_8_21_14_0_20_46_8]
MKLIDISLPLNAKTIIYPGNPPVKIVPKQGATSTHSEISFGSHTGTHLDAPSHVFKKGMTLDKLPLEDFFGKCRVLDMTHCKEAVRIEDLKKARIKKGERILFKTKNSLRGFKKFRNDYIYLDGDAAEWLAAKSVRLVGIDSLSIKQRGSTDTRPHDALLAKKIPILESIDLKKVVPGTYTLCCFPLAFTGIDGSPVRAVLIA